MYCVHLFTPFRHLQELNAISSTRLKRISLAEGRRKHISEKLKRNEKQKTGEENYLHNCYVCMSLFSYFNVVTKATE